MVWAEGGAAMVKFQDDPEEAMTEEKVTVFRPYPLTVGQKIRIEGGKRGGDWLVIGVTDRTVTLRCPVSLREFEWSRFCYFVEEQQGAWPRNG